MKEGKSKNDKSVCRRCIKERKLQDHEERADTTANNET